MRDQDEATLDRRRDQDCNPAEAERRYWEILDGKEAEFAPANERAEAERPYRLAELQIKEEERWVRRM